VIPIVTPEEMAAIDAAAPEPVDVLIHRAGGALARAAVDLLGGTYGRRVVVLAGKGNNGNDGRDAAARLRARGVRVTEIDAAEPPDHLPDCDLVIDAGFGTGFRGSFHPPATEAPVLACDIPSGVAGLTGEVGARSYEAVATVTFAALKPGLVLEPGSSHVGAVEVADIGLDTSSARAHLLEAGDVTALVPRRSTTDHKWRSACWVVGGSPGMTGAPSMAAAAAMRAGAGYARLSVPGGGAIAGVAPEVVTTSLPAAGWGAAVLDDADRFGALVLGPGLGREEAAATEVRRLVTGAPGPTLVDGDGLRALTDGDPVQADGGHPVVLTPHDGEFEALAGEPPGPDRFAAVRSLADRLGAVVLLKGPCTIVADPTGRVLAAAEGDARLASAGTGDVLAGIIGALLARGMPALEAAAVGAFVHGRAGAVGWHHGLVATDLIDRLPAVLDDLLE
jgi:NAD(P)H-hydrate epimerase